MAIKITCCNCYVPFWIEEEHNEELKRTKATFYCPNGHPQSYVGKSDKEKAAELREEVERQRKLRINERVEKNQEIAHLKNKVKTYKGHLTRKKSKEEKGENGKKSSS